MGIYCDRVRFCSRGNKKRMLWKCADLSIRINSGARLVMRIVHNVYSYLRETKLTMKEQLSMNLP